MLINFMSSSSVWSSAISRALHFVCSHQTPVYLILRDIWIETLYMLIAYIVLHKDKHKILYVYSPFLLWKRESFHMESIWWKIYSERETSTMRTIILVPNQTSTPFHQLRTKRLSIVGQTKELPLNWTNVENTIERTIRRYCVIFRRQEEWNQ